jgi:hypothetical protein
MAIQTPLLTPASSSQFPPTAPYPPTFAEIVALIQSGAPIPGIIDVPNIVLYGQGSKPTARLRRKPWEMHKTEEEVQANKGEGMFGDHRDVWIRQEYPEEESKEGKEEKKEKDEEGRV